MVNYKIVSFKAYQSLPFRVGSFRNSGGGNRLYGLEPNRIHSSDLNVRQMRSRGITADRAGIAPTISVSPLARWLAVGLFGLLAMLFSVTSPSVAHTKSISGGELESASSSHAIYSQLDRHYNYTAPTSDNSMSSLWGDSQSRVAGNGETRAAINSSTMTHFLTLANASSPDAYWVAVSSSDASGSSEDVGDIILEPDEPVLSVRRESVTSSDATLVLSDWFSVWHYRYNAPDGGGCSPEVPAGTSSQAVTGLSGNTNYTFEAYSDSSCSSQIGNASVTFLTRPAQPTLTLDYDGGSQLTLRASGVGGSAALTRWQYKQNLNTEANFPENWTPIANSTSATLSHTVEGLSNNGTYQFRVQAVNASGASAESATSAARRPRDAILSYNDLTASGMTLIISYWTSPWHYKYTTPSGGTCSAEAVPVNGGRTSVSGLAGNTDYIFEAYSDSGCNSLIAASDPILTLPGKPSKPIIGKAGTGKLTLSSSVGGAGTVFGWQYRQKARNNDYGNWIFIPGSTSPALTNHEIGGLDDGASYAFQVRVINLSGVGAASEDSAAQSPGSATLTFGTPTASSIPLTIGNWSGDWHYKPSSGGCSPKVSAGTMSATASGLTGNTFYTFSAYSDASCSSLIASASAALTKPGVPTGFTVGKAGGGKLTLTASAGGDGAITGWEYAQKSTGDYGDWKTISNSAGSTLSHTFGSLTDGTDYTFKVRALNASGEGTASNGSAATAPGESALTVASGTVSPSGATLALSNWSAAWHYKNSSPDGGVCSPEVPAGASSQAMTGLSGNTDYTFEAYSDPSCSSQIDKTSATFLTKPGAPIGLVVGKAGSGKLTLAASVLGTGSIAGWEYAHKSTGDYGDWKTISNSAGSTLSYTIDGLTEGTGYAFKVRALNASGEGLASNGSTATAPGESALTVTSGTVSSSGATLALSNWSAAWHYKYSSPDGGVCSPEVPAGTSSQAIIGLSGNMDYTFEAYSDSICSSQIDKTSAMFLTKPGAPAGFMFGKAGSGKVMLTASVGGDGAISHWQYWQSRVGSNYASWVTIFDSSTETLSHTVSNLSDSETYRFKVRAVNAAGSGSETGEIIAGPSASALTVAPSTVSSSGATLALSNWSAPWHYKNSSPDGGVCSSEVPAGTSSQAVTGLSGNTGYTFEAYSDASCSSQIDKTSATFLTKPGAPAGFTVGKSSSGKLTLSATSSGSGTITSWQYAQKAGGNYGSWKTISGSPGSTLLHTVGDLNSSTNYTFKVRAVNAAGVGDESADSAAEAPGESVLASSGIADTGVTLSLSNWSAEWHYRLASGNCSSKVVGELGGTSSVRVTGLAGNTSYTFKAYSNSSCTNQIDSNSVTVLTIPAQPSTPVVGQAGSAKLTLSALVTGGSAALNWEYSQKSGNAYGSWTSIDGANSPTLSHVVSGLANGASYSFKVRAKNATGYSAESAESAAAQPGAAALTVSGIGETTATLKISNWSGNWHHKYNTPSGGTCSPAINGGTYTTDISGLTGNTDYAYQAFSGNCASSFAAAASFVTKPSKPSRPVATNGTGSGELTIKAAVSGEGSIAKWQYQEKKGNGPFSSWTDIDNSNSAMLSFLRTGLDDGTEYAYRVRAFNASGHSVASEISLPSGPQAESLQAAYLSGVAKLTLRFWPKDWYYKLVTPEGGKCSNLVSAINYSAADKKSTVTLNGLAGNAIHEFEAYTDSSCADRLVEKGELRGNHGADNAQFLTVPGRPTAPIAAAGEAADALVITSSVAGDGAIIKWQYKLKADNGSFGDDWADIPNSATPALEHIFGSLNPETSYQFKLRAWNRTGPGGESETSAAAKRADGRLTGAEKADNAWLAPLGRTIATQAVELMAERFRTPAETQIALGGEVIPLSLGSRDNMPLPLRGHWISGDGIRSMTGRELLLGSSFHLTTEGGDDHQEGLWTVWGRIAHEEMEDLDDGVAVKGEVTTGMIAADWQRGPWLFGSGLAFSKGKGDLVLNGRKFEASSKMTSLNPYVRYRISDRLQIWGSVGLGRGSMTFSETVRAGSGMTYKADLTMTMVSTGLRTEIWKPQENGGYGLAVRGDAFWVRVDSDAARASDGSDILAPTSTDVSRVRVAVEATHPMTLDAGGTLTPLLEVGIRHDSGDSVNGAGLDLGGGMVFKSADSRLILDFRARYLLVHADSNRREWGIVGLVRYLPNESQRGLSASLAHSRGADAGGSGRLWSARGAGELAASETADAGRLDAEVGYGLPAAGGKMTQTPYIGFGDTGTGQDWLLGWRLTEPGGLFETSLEAARKIDGGGNAKDSFGLLATIKW